MIRSATIVGLLLGLLSPVVAQERHASIRLEDGRALEGRVLSMDLKELVIRVGDKVLLVPATEIRSCRFREPEASKAPDAAAADPTGSPTADPSGASGAGAGPQGQAPAAKPAKPAVVAPAERLAGAAPAEAAPVDPPAAPGGETASPATPAPTAAEVGDASGVASKEAETAKSGSVPSGEPAASEDATAAEPRITWDGPLEDPEIEAPRKGLAPHWMPRLQRLDAAYPWLRPAQPSQWISLGLLLFVGMGLIVHFSVRIAGAERVLIERSILLGVWYLLTGLGQVALVPVSDLSVTLMLLANTTLSLFLTCALFGLHRFGATVALIVQLGFAVLIFGVLELVSSLLSTVGVTPGVTS
ncbi:MAG: hypothetical protein AB8H80_23315 [Planctomycetota bacterium]